MVGSISEPPSLELVWPVTSLTFFHSVIRIGACKFKSKRAGGELVMGKSSATHSVIELGRLKGPGIENREIPRVIGRVLAGMLSKCCWKERCPQGMVEVFCRKVFIRS